MVKERTIYNLEFTAIILLWAFVIIAPLLFTDSTNKNWTAIHIMWAECAVVGFAYLINRCLLMPRLFFSKRYTAYACSIIALFLSLCIFILYFDGVNLILSLFGEGNIESARPPMMGNSIPPPNTPPHMPPHGASPHISAPPTHSIIPPSITVLILSLIVIALDMGLSIAVKWIIAEQKQTLIDKERVAAQLSNLQSQVSPHFFMNTLNNIHALVDIDSKRAKQTIIELSGLMDYLLYESSSKERVSLQKELDFINNYINLMRLRFSDQVKIYFSYDDDVPSVKIPPLLFLNFIENAFKYGVDYDNSSFIKIRIDFSETTIEMSAMNSNHSESVKSSRHGLGINNSRKRLELLYGDRYTLEITDIDKIYYVNLKIPIL
ncbi:MAG: histidine kinase [Rikenellaceae bacterium]